MKIKVNGVLFENVDVDNRQHEVRLDAQIEDIVSFSQGVYKTGVVEVLYDDNTPAYTINENFTNIQVFPNGEYQIIKLTKKIESQEDVINEKINEQAKVMSIVFVQMAQNGTLDDVTISEHPDLFIEWTENWTGKAGSIVREGENLYRSIHDVTNVAQNTRPSETPSMWTRIGNPEEEYPEWVQPIGAHDAYNINDKASHNNKNWISETDGNVWEPGVYGWTEVTA